MEMLLSSFIKNPRNARYDGEDKDENIVYLFRGSFITNLGWISLTILALFVPFIASLFYPVPGKEFISPDFAFIIVLFWYLAVIGFAYHKFLIWYFNVYIVSDKKVVDIDFHGLLYKNISEAPIRNVEDVTSKVKGSLRMIFNYGYVYIQTAGSQREIEFEDVDNPAKVRDLISDFVVKLRYGR